MTMRQKTLLVFGLLRAAVPYKFIYDLWGGTDNTASCMESHRWPMACR